MARTPERLVAFDSSTATTSARADGWLRVMGRAESPKAALPTGLWRAVPRLRSEAAGGISMLAGGWLVISPFVVGYVTGDMVSNTVAGGGLVALVALAYLLGLLRLSWFGGLSAAAGVWVLMSALWLTASTLAAWSTWFVGVVVLVMAVWSIAAANTAG